MQTLVPDLDGLKLATLDQPECGLAGDGEQVGHVCGSQQRARVLHGLRCS
jgi:hypothetical protein